MESDAELGFVRPTRQGPGNGSRWTLAAIVHDATTAMEWDLLNRRNALQSAATIGGAGLLEPLAGWLEPIAEAPLSARAGAFSVAEVQAVEHLVVTFRS
ncbi:MAG: hypothetical protein ACR2GH_05715 [Pseudonocardia sp.]